ncbi:Phytanoyl-CoA dioxygenase (PhyH) [Roseomonas rosea]|uniref:Phytanoyl-CoA dioxygenase (PhyH) n=1 Tax=Muricoccus roseus TaxID=198092 RepID=A0A1M6B4S0_9PROT|nr:phytanoyl-CoA dioxygenase family protein [Roseomonas rosea]SHI43762.1 Phytanoyl-CoA dioxygenase (PhyH) [Roseomonas rosea]
MPKRLDEAQLEGFRRDGVVFPLRVLEEAEAAGLHARLEELEGARAGRLPPAANAKPHLLLPWLWDLVHDPRIVGPVEDILGPDLLCWGTSFISKRADDGRYVSWHQDATHWDLSSPEAVTAWIALTPSTPETGCVRMLPGTHAEQLPHGHTQDAANMLGRREHVMRPIDEDRAIDVVLAPGEMSIHHALVIHGSAPNQGQTRRTGFAIRYIPASTRQNRRRNSATHVRGKDFGHFDPELAPEGDFHPDAVARHRAVLRRGMEVIFAPENKGDAAGPAEG